MIELFRRILGIGAKTRNPRTPKRPPRKEPKGAVVRRDFVGEAVRESARAEEAERAAAKQRYKKLNASLVDAVVGKAIDNAQYEARNNARTAATAAVKQGKGRIFIISAGRESAQQTYRSAINRAMLPYIADFDTRQTNRAESGYGRFTGDQHSRTDREIAMAIIEKAAMIEHESAMRRYKNLDPSLVDHAIQVALNQIDNVKIGDEQPSDIFRRAIDRTIQDLLVKERGATGPTEVAKRKPDRTSGKADDSKNYSTRKQNKRTTKAAKRKPEKISGKTEDRRNPGTRNQKTKTSEIKQLNAELESLNARHVHLSQRMRDVTFRGGKKSKNADYHDTKEQLIALEDRIQFYQQALASALDSRSQSSRTLIQVGSTVVIRFQDCEDDEIYKIVVSRLGKGLENTISAKSPTGSALLGKRKGDNVTIHTPNGIEKLRIIDVH